MHCHCMRGQYRGETDQLNTLGFAVCMGVRSNRGPAAADLIVQSAIADWLLVLHRGAGVDGGSGGPSLSLLRSRLPFEQVSAVSLPMIDVHLQNCQLNG